MSYPNGCMDVGFWVGEHLHKLCHVSEEIFSLDDFPEYAAHAEPRAPVQVQDDPRVHSCENRKQLLLKLIEFMSTMSNLLSRISF